MIPLTALSYLFVFIALANVVIASEHPHSRDVND